MSSVLNVTKHFSLTDQLYKTSGEHYRQTTQSIQHFSLIVSHYLVSKFQPHNDTLLTSRRNRKAGRLRLQKYGNKTAMIQQ